MPLYPSRAASLTAALLSLSLGTAAPAGACGFDSGLDGSFGAIHPKSITVAFAINDAVQAGVIGKAAIAPIVPGNAGYWRAVGHLNRFHALLAAAEAKPATPISIVFIDSNLWARMVPTASGLELSVHTAGAQAGDAVIVTSEAIVTALLDRGLTADDATEKGLLAIDGPASEATRKLVLAAFDPAGRPDRQEKSMPSRLFGPARLQ
jgi:hypothetical protein